MPSPLAVIDTSISEAATKRLSQHIFTGASPLFVPGYLPKFLPPGPTLHCRLKFVQQGLLWHFFQLPDHALRFMEICVCYSLHSEPALCSGGLCVLLLSLWACPLCHGGLCALLSASWAHRLHCRALCFYHHPGSSFCKMMFVCASFTSPSWSSRKSHGP